MGGHEHDAGRRRGGDHRVGGGDGRRHGLLDEHVLARLAGRDGQLGMEGVGGADVDGVDVVAREHVPPVADDVAASPLVPRGGGRRLAPALEGDDVDDVASERLEPGEVSFGDDGAAGEDGDAQRPVAHASATRALATLAMAVATSSQSASEYAAPMGTMTARDARSSLLGHRPGP